MLLINLSSNFLLAGLSLPQTIFQFHIIPISLIQGGNLMAHTTSWRIQILCIVLLVLTGIFGLAIGSIIRTEAQLPDKLEQSIHPVIPAERLLFLVAQRDKPSGTPFNYRPVFRQARDTIEQKQGKQASLAQINRMKQLVLPNYTSLFHSVSITWGRPLARKWDSPAGRISFQKHDPEFDMQTYGTRIYMHLSPEQFDDLHLSALLIHHLTHVGQYLEKASTARPPKTEDKLLDRFSGIYANSYPDGPEQKLDPREAYYDNEFEQEANAEVDRLLQSVISLQNSTQKSIRYRVIWQNLSGTVKTEGKTKIKAGEKRVHTFTGMGWAHPCIKYSNYTCLTAGPLLGATTLPVFGDGNVYTFRKNARQLILTP
jgi:hypothetical protein